MAIVPFQPNSNWNWKDAKYKFISMIMIGLLGTFFALLFIYPILSINLVTDAGTQLGAYAKNVVDLSCGGTMEAVNMVGSVVNGLGGGAVSTITELTAQTVMAVELIGDVIQSMSDLLGPVTSLLNGGVKDVLSAVSLAVGYISNTIGKTMKLASDSVGGVITNILPLLGSIQEAMSFIITNGFTPAVQTLNGIRGMLADKIEAFSKSELPRVIDAFKILQSVSQSQIFGDGSMAILTLTVALYVKAFKRVTGILTDSSIVTDLVSSTVNAIASITVDLSALSFNFCDVLVGIIEPVFSLLNIPGSGDLNNCALDFIKLGLWYMSNGSFCQTTPGSAIVTNFTNCLFGEIAYITLIPGYSIDIGITTIFNSGLGNFPGLEDWILAPIYDLMRTLMSGLPEITIGWSDINLNTIFTGLGNVLYDIFNGFKSIFSAKLVSLLPTSPTQVLLPLILLYTIYKILERLSNIVINLIDDFIDDAVDLVDSWTGCEYYGACFDPCEYIPLVPSCEICLGVTMCISDLFSSMGAVKDAVRAFFEPIVYGYFNLSAIISQILPFTPSLPSGSLLTNIDNVINTVLSSATLGSLPVTVGLS